MNEGVSGGRSPPPPAFQPRCPDAGGICLSVKERPKPEQSEPELAVSSGSRSNGKLKDVGTACPTTENGASHDKTLIAFLTDKSLKSIGFYSRRFADLK